MLPRVVAGDKWGEMKGLRTLPPHQAFTNPRTGKVLGPAGRSDRWASAAWRGPLGSRGPAARGLWPPSAASRPGAVGLLKVYTGSKLALSPLDFLFYICNEGDIDEKRPQSGV